VFFVTVFICLNTYGQNAYIGRIDASYSPYAVGFCADCFVLTLGTISGDTYFLTLDSSLLPTNSGKLIVGGTEYAWGDIFAITGTATVKQGGYLKEYYELEIETIEKTSLNQDIQRFLGTYVMGKGDCGINFAGNTTIIEMENEFLLRLDDHPYFPFAILFFFVEGDSLFIPMQWIGSQYPRYESLLRGKGKVDNDSIFLNIIIGNYHANDFSTNFFDTCNIKGIRKGVYIPPIETIPTKVYYNTINQEIVIDEALQNQFLTLELYDIQGKMLLRKTNVGNSVSIAHLPQGVYVYRLMQENQVICRGKVLK
jgi:hypothetical protein